MHAQVHAFKKTCFKGIIIYNVLSLMEKNNSYNSSSLSHLINVCYSELVLQVWEQNSLNTITTEVRIQTSYEFHGRKSSTTKTAF